MAAKKKRPTTTKRRSLPLLNKFLIAIVALIAAYFLFTGLADSEGLRTLAGLACAAIAGALFKAKHWPQALILALITAAITYWVIKFLP